MADNKENVTENLSVEDKINELRIKYLKADIVWKLVSVIVFIITGAYVVLVFKRIINFNFLTNSLIVLALLIAIFLCVQNINNAAKYFLHILCTINRFQDILLFIVLDKRLCLLTINC